MTYDEALVYLKGREKFGIKFGLANVDRLAEALRRPERRYHSLLVAGTNGKGSTVALSESILRASGFLTGRYTSPHLRFVEERIYIAGRPITREELASAVSQVADAAEQLFEGDPSVPTYFEAMTAAAFLAFAERGVEVAVLEVGMGGRFDATNIAPADVSVIAPIGFDHERFLGGTIGAIAAEKAAIIKPGRPVVVGRLEPEALDVVRREAESKNAPLVEALDGVKIRSEETAKGQTVWLETPTRDYGALELPLSGEHQLDNLALAVRAVECFSESLDVGAVARGVAATEWPGRLQRIEGRPSILLDAAHNVMATEALVRYLKSHPHPRRVLLFGVMKDKRVWEMLEQLLPLVSFFIATRPEMSRARDPEKLARFAKERGVPAESVRSPEVALARARELAGPDGEVLVAGSIFLLGEIQSAL
ncbi:MAG TPA: folylpolyglutamate synthase/dihydrofolate synthase family protein [Vicinamibacteria bacterium]